jgi:hypothetical protein
VTDTSLPPQEERQSEGDKVEEKRLKFRDGEIGRKGINPFYEDMK